mmetsp:Transcript_1300/g.2251  ORF Transcript_1300/g.2251 Transcript_1300/m.2251 type:complete len:984 (+) Transcript_1300:142-3093(+)
MGDGDGDDAVNRVRGGGIRSVYEYDYEQPRTAAAAAAVTASEAADVAADMATAGTAVPPNPSESTAALGRSPRLGPMSPRMSNLSSLTSNRNLNNVTNMRSLRALSRSRQSWRRSLSSADETLEKKLMPIQATPEETEPPTTQQRLRIFSTGEQERVEESEFDEEEEVQAKETNEVREFFVKRPFKCGLCIFGAILVIVGGCMEGINAVDVRQVPQALLFVGSSFMMGIIADIIVILFGGLLTWMVALAQTKHKEVEYSLAVAHFYYDSVVYKLSFLLWNILTIVMFTSFVPREDDSTDIVASWATAYYHLTRILGILAMLLFSRVLTQLLRMYLTQDFGIRSFATRVKDSLDQELLCCKLRSVRPNPSFVSLVKRLGNSNKSGGYADPELWQAVVRHVNSHHVDGFEPHTGKHAPVKPGKDPGLGRRARPVAASIFARLIATIRMQREEFLASESEMFYDRVEHSASASESAATAEMGDQYDNTKASAEAEDKNPAAEESSGEQQPPLKKLQSKQSQQEDENQSKTEENEQPYTSRSQEAPPASEFYRPLPRMSNIEEESAAASEATAAAARAIRKFNQRRAESFRTIRSEDHAVDSETLAAAEDDDEQFLFDPDDKGTVVSNKVQSNVREIDEIPLEALAEIAEEIDVVQNADITTRSKRELLSHLSSRLGNKVYFREEVLDALKELDSAYDWDKVWKNYLDPRDTGVLTWPRLRTLIFDFYETRYNLSLSIQDSKSAIKSMDVVIMSVFLILVILISLSFYTTDLATMLSSMSTVILGYSFIFGGSVTTSFENIVFLFGVHPYDVGDTLLFNDNRYTVSRIRLLTTDFIQADGAMMRLTNEYIAALGPIFNLNTSENHSIGFSIYLPAMDVRESNITAIRKSLDEFFKLNSVSFDSYGFTAREFIHPLEANGELPSKGTHATHVRFYLWVTFNFSFEDAGRIFAEQTRLITHMCETLAALGLSKPLLDESHSRSITQGHA